MRTLQITLLKFTLNWKVAVQIKRLCHSPLSIKRSMEVNMNLTLNETRVIGSLIEKEITRPDLYPLSLNSLINACNQKSNREPVLELTEDTVQETIDQLINKGLASVLRRVGSRVIKMRHRLYDSGFDGSRFSPQELGIICVLFLRGPATPGELRIRTSRLCKFSSTIEIETVLKNLMVRDDGPFIVKLNKEAGKRGFRYAHLFCKEVDALSQKTESAPDNCLIYKDSERINVLEFKLAEVQNKFEEITIE